MRSLMVVLLGLPLVAAAGEPFTVDAPVPMGLVEAKSVVVGLNQDERGTVTKTSVAAFAFAKGKWKKAKTPVKPWEVDSAVTEDPKGKIEHAKETFAAGVERLGATTVEVLSGKRTGRYRVQAWGLVVYLENDQVMARVGDATDIKTLPIIKDFGKLAGKCLGTRENSIVEVSAFEAWKGVAVVVESKCTPPEGDVHPATRVRRLVVQDVSPIVQ